MPVGPLIECRVIDVDIERWIIKVVPETGNIDQVQLSCPYVHFKAGQGSYSMPEEGSLCLVAYDTKGNPYILAFIVPAGDEEDENTKGYKANRENLNKGDVVVAKTVAGNKVIVRSSGMIEIESNPTCRLIITPDKDVFDFILGRLYLTGINLGTIAWDEVDNEINFEWTFKDNAIIGAGIPGVWDGAKVKIRVGAKPKVFDIRIFSNLGIETAKIHCDDSGSWTIEGGMLLLKASTKIQLGSKLAIQAFVLGIKLLIWLAKHVHPTPSGMSGPPTPAPTREDFLSDKIAGE